MKTTRKHSLTIILVSLVIIILSLGLIGCAKKSNKPKYEYPYNAVTDISPDDGMNIDGILDEAVYKNKKYMTFSQSNAECSVTTHFGKKGLYVGFIVRSSYIYYNAPYNMNSNSSIEIFISSEEKTDLDANVVQIAVDTQNKWSSTYVIFLGAATVQGDAINTGSSDGMTAEFFIPWTELGLEHMPQKVKMFPGFNHVAALGATNGLKIRPVGNINKPLNYYIFDNNGYINADEKGAIVGDSITGISKSCGWDISGLAQEDAVVRSIEDDAQFMFFKDIYADKYIIEATITPKAILRGNSGPKVGLMIGYDGNPMSYTSTYNEKSGFMFDISSNYFLQNQLIADKVYAKVMNFFHTGWETTDFIYANNKPLMNGGLNYQNGIKMKVIKFNETFFYYIEDMLVYINEIDYLSDKALPGLFTIGCEALFSNMKVADYSENEEELINIISQDAYILSVAKSDGGTVNTSAMAVVKNIDTSLMSIDNDIELIILPDNRSMVTQLDINGEDKLDDARAKMKEGIYYLANVNSDMDIKVHFNKLDTTELIDIETYVGLDEDIQNPSAVHLSIIGNDDKTIYYTPALRLITADGHRRGMATVSLASGDYIFRYMLDGYITQTIVVNVKDSQPIKLDTIILQRRIAYGTKVSGCYNDSSWELSSNGYIDYSEEEDNRIRLGDNSNLYFSQATNKNIIKARITGVSSAEGKRDKKAGIIIAGYRYKGIETKYSIVVDRENRDIKLLIEQTGENHSWSNFQPFDIDITDNIGAEIAIVRNKNDIYIYINDEFIYSIDIGITQEAAVGFITIGSQAYFNDFAYLTDFSSQDVIEEYNRLIKKI